MRGLNGRDGIETPPDGIDGQVHLPSRNEINGASPSVRLRNQEIECCLEPAAQQHGRIPFLCAMRVQLNKTVAFDAWREVHPSLGPVGRRDVVARKFTRLESGEQTVPPTNSERSGNHEQISFNSSAGNYGHTAII